MRFVRRLLSAVMVAVLAATLPAAPAWTATNPPRFDPNCPRQTGGPATAADWASWLAAMRQWRTDERAAMGYNPVNYARPELAWAQRNPIQPQVMVEDRYLYDPAEQRYTVDRYLADVRARYGGIDSVLIWPTYPNIGVDNRNTREMLLDMPGGLTGVRQMVADFKAAGVRVMFPIMFWDNGTHDPGAPWSQILPSLMAQLGADGLNGDTMRSIPAEYFQPATPLVLEPELGLETAADRATLGWNLQSWGYWCLPRAPLVSLSKWLEPRHTVHVNDRWSGTKVDLLQAAFFNGTGLSSWENVWGIFNPLTGRDGEAIRRVAAIERKFGDLLVSQGWEPYTPTIQSTDVFASRWPIGTRVLYTLVNRDTNDKAGDQLRVAHAAGVRYFDLWQGVELTPRLEGSQAVLAFPMERKGFGAILAGAPGDLPADLSTFLAQMRGWAARRLDSFPDTRTVLAQTMTPVSLTQAYASAPSGMVPVPGANFPYHVRGTEIEGGWYSPGMGVQYPWETTPSRHHTRVVNIKPFYIDRTPVTNAMFKLFLNSTGYRPADAHNFLKDWNWSDPAQPDYPPGWDNKPVTWVSIEDARAWAAWAGRRLPTGWEWQYATQGLDGRFYPWGDAWDPSRVPTVFTGRGAIRPPDNVDAHPSGAGPFGALDMVGNVWQWTDEFTDARTRTAALRGGSYYRALGSHWYFPSDQAAYRLDHHNKYLLMAPGRDRAATIGFRTVADSTGVAVPPVSNGALWDLHTFWNPPTGWTGYEDLETYGHFAIGGTRPAGGSAQFVPAAFTGTGIDVYGWRGPNGGAIRVLVDGQVRATVSQNAPLNRYNQLLARISGLANGSHTLRLEMDPAGTAVGQWTMVDYIRVYGPTDVMPGTLIEAEQLAIPAGATVQGDCCGVTWSGGKQIWFQANGPGDTYTLTFTVPRTTRYNLTLLYTKAWDFGIQTRTLDGVALGGPYDHGLPAGVALDRQTHAGIQLSAGQHQLTFTVTGKRATSPRYGFGLDAILLDPAP